MDGERMLVIKVGLNSWQCTFGHSCESSPPLKYLSRDRTELGIGNLLLITVRRTGNGLLGIYHVYTRTRVSQKRLSRVPYLSIFPFYFWTQGSNKIVQAIGGFLEIDYSILTFKER